MTSTGNTRGSFDSAVAKLDALFAPWDRSSQPGITVGVALADSPLYRRGFGMASLECGTVLTPSTQQRIGSITKHFTALLALEFAADGVLDLDQPIRAYLPELTGPGGDPTVRQLLQHQGGSRCYLELAMYGHGDALLPQGGALATQVAQRAASFAPGSAVLYNNGGYHIVSLALERIGGAPFGNLLKGRLLEPVGMYQSEIVSSDYMVTAGLAAMHVKANSAWRRGQFMTEELLGEGGLVSTVDDMLRWARHLRKHDRFGSAESWQELVEQPTLSNGWSSSYALGLIVGTYRGHIIHHHSGGVIGGSAQLLTFPDDELDIILIANGAPGADVVTLAERVADIILGDDLAEPEPLISTVEFPELVGDWWDPTTAMVYTFLDVAGELRLTLLGSQEPLAGRPLRKLSDTELVTARGFSEIRIATGHLRSTQSITVHSGGDVAICHRIGRGGDWPDFLALAVGEFRGVDFDWSIEFFLDERAKIHLRIKDSVGHVEFTALPFSVDGALLTSRVSGYPLWGVIHFEPNANPGSKLRLNLPRGRNFIFSRVER